MELNNIIFPAPKNFNIPLSSYADELIFIPRTKANKISINAYSQSTHKTKPNPHKNNPYEKLEKLSEKEKINYLEEKTKSPKHNSKNKFNLFSKNKNKNDKNIELINYEKLTEEGLLGQEDEKESKDFFNNFHSENASDYIPCLLLLLQNSRNKSALVTQKNHNKVCVFFHGNAEDIFLARDFAEKLRESLEMNILLVEYPGYSIYFDEKSSTKIIENSVIVYDFLVEEIGLNALDLIIMGRSIGTAPASYLASKRPVAALTLLSAFVSVRAVAENLIGRLLKFIVSERFENIQYIAEVESPVLFIHGLKDDMIPFEHTLRLKEECKAPFEVLLPEEMDHNDFDLIEHLIKPLKAFLQRHVEGATDKDWKNKDSIVDRMISVPNRYFLVPFCVVKMIKKADDEHNKPSVFACLGF